MRLEPYKVYGFGFVWGFFLLSFLFCLVLIFLVSFSPFWSVSWCVFSETTSSPRDYLYGACVCFLCECVFLMSLQCAKCISRMSLYTVVSAATLR